MVVRFLVAWLLMIAPVFAQEERVLILPEAQFQYGLWKLCDLYLCPRDGTVEQSLDCLINRFTAGDRRSLADIGGRTEVRR